jgi:cytoskeletal protein CcmA (bactofilin family)
MKLKKDNADELQSLLGEGVEMVGELSFARGLLVEGIVKGKLRSEGSLMIGAKGRVEAEVVIQKVSINGEFRGVIHASDRVEINKSGKVYGDIYTPCLIIEGGAVFEGRCNMSERGPSRPEEGLLPKTAETGPETGRAPAKPV